MKKINLKIAKLGGLEKISPQIEKLLEQIKIRSKPVIDYYNRLNEREKQIVFLGLILLILMFVYLFISGAYSFQTSLEKDYTVIQTYRADAQYLGKIYKDINQFTPNEFSDVSADRLKGDFTSIAKDPPDVQQIGDNITINVSQAKFSDIMNVLNQSRKTYGIFPSKLRVTRLSEAGYVSFSATFRVSTQNGQ
jgi:type II secretory pathway component PulM